ncbi:4Fe-4S dicluster domain-containing protein [bacterium]|nr:4Fe-4S dicluster domain-containing protein [bacterium]
METSTKKIRGVVHIEPDRCKGCGFCVEFCPTHVLEMSQDFNVQGYHYPVAVKPEACTGCDQCGAFCPDYAIFGKRV